MLVGWHIYAETRNSELLIRETVNFKVKSSFAYCCFIVKYCVTQPSCFLRLVDGNLPDIYNIPITHTHESRSIQSVAYSDRSVRFDSSHDVILITQVTIGSREISVEAFVVACSAYKPRLPISLEFFKRRNVASRVPLNGRRLV